MAFDLDPVEEFPLILILTVLSDCIASLVFNEKRHRELVGRIISMRRG
jgi:hypothetical protein